VRAIVTGGTGFIGRAVVRSLCERGDDVVVLTRGRGARAPGPRKHCCNMAGRVELATWTPEEPGDWQRRVDGADVVIHLAGAPVLDERWTGERMALLRSSRVRSTELLAQAIARAASRPRVFVSGSAIGYYGTKTGDSVLDDRAPAGDDFLAKLVVDWARAAGPAREVGVRVVHPRIGIALGHGGGVLDKLLPIFKAYVGGPVGDGKQWVSWVHRADVVSAIEHAIVRDDVSGPFNVTAPSPVTMNDFARALGDALHRPAALRVPAAAVRVALGDGAAEVILTGPRAVPSRLAASDFAFLFPDLRSALADLVAKPERVVL
jgi:uncharacterized protein (TIGR01777 family)